MENVRLPGGRTIRVGAWRGDPTTANLATFADMALRATDVEQSIDLLRDRGYERVVTAALMRREHDAFTEVGFSPLRHLLLLRRSLDVPFARTTHRLRRHRKRSLDDILDVDNAAFEEFWRFDEAGLRDALSATPHRVLRVTRDEPIIGYALSGASAGRGYLQRLAVVPQAAGTGVGSALLLDALRWMRLRGASEAFVNTQADNERALALYLRHGFDVEPDGLVVFERTL